MSLLLKAFLNGATQEEALAASTRELSKIAARKNKFSFRVTHRNGFITTEIYPELTNADKGKSKD